MVSPNYFNQASWICTAHACCVLVHVYRSCTQDATLSSPDNWTEIISAEKTLVQNRWTSRGSVRWKPPSGPGEGRASGCLCPLSAHISCQMPVVMVLLPSHAHISCLGRAWTWRQLVEDEACKHRCPFISLTLTWLVLLTEITLRLSLCGLTRSQTLYKRIFTQLPTKWEGNMRNSYTAACGELHCCCHLAIAV
jgi:hypothetical protein